MSHFPSRQHHHAIRAKLLRHREVSLSEDERRYWHAYAYAFRRVYMGEWEQISPIDRDGQWFDGAMVDSATAEMRGRRG